MWQAHNFAYGVALDFAIDYLRIMLQIFAQKIKGSLDKEWKTRFVIYRLFITPESFSRTPNILSLKG
jgi:hypothetical protein